MELKDILVVAFATLIVLVISHLAVFWVIRTLYPPLPVVQQQAEMVFTQPPVQQQPEPQQHVSIPTYEAPVSVEASREEEPRKGPPPPESTSIHGSSRVDSANAQPRE